MGAAPAVVQWSMSGRRKLTAGRPRLQGASCRCVVLSFCCLFARWLPPTGSCPFLVQCTAIFSYFPGFRWHNESAGASATPGRQGSPRAGSPGTKGVMVHSPMLARSRPIDNVFGGCLNCSTGGLDAAIIPPDLLVAAGRRLECHLPVGIHRHPIDVCRRSISVEIGSQST